MKSKRPLRGVDLSSSSLSETKNRGQLVLRPQELDKANNHLADSIKARQEKEKKDEENEKANEDPNDAMAVDQETQPDAKDKSSDKKSKKKEESSQGDPATVTGARLFEITQCFGALLEVRAAHTQDREGKECICLNRLVDIWERHCSRRQVENAYEMRSKSTWPLDSYSTQRKLPMLLLSSRARILQATAK